MRLVIALLASALAGAAAPALAKSKAAPAAAAPLASADSQDLLQQASWAMAALEYGEAFDLATRAIKADPRSAAAFALRALIGNKLKRYEAALQDENSALALAPSDSTALLERSWTLARLERYPQALQDAQAVLKEHPENRFAYQNAAAALAGLGDRDSAVGALRRAAELNPDMENRYAEARQAASADEILSILDRHEDAQGIAPSRKAPPRFLTLSLLTVSGGLLIALGILSFFPAGTKSKERRSREERPRSAKLRPHTAASRAGSGDAPAPYEIVQPIGQSALDLSYEARDTSLNRLVTIRKMRREIRADADARRRFLQQARTIALLRHPHIADVYQAVEENGDIFIISEWFEGLTLDQVLKRYGALDYHRARKVLKPLCAAVDYAHGKGVIHGGLRPEIIRVSKDGLVKITDFGLARAIEDTLLAPARQASSSLDPNDYAAPEQDNGAP
ncbi:MAG: protein kinase, partial [Elusimicrobia bacterium]|nr:protein kinase [Elusimicrobiota bacterium]